MFLATVELMPAIYESSENEAVFKSTPTWFTQPSTTPPKAVSMRFLGISCWYWPTPMALGSILTSSARGSCNLLAMETALRRETSNWGNSSAASLDAEYTDAPASLTTM